MVRPAWSHSLDNKHIPLVLWGLIATQLLLLAWTFPLASLWSDDPLFHIDNAAHWYRIVFAVNAASEGLLTGYDPYFNAGTAAGIAANPAAKIPAGIAVLAQTWMAPADAWKWYVILASLAASVCVPLALRMLRVDPMAVVMGGVLGLLLWWVSVFRWYHTAGMVSYVFGAYVGLPYVALVARYLLGWSGWVSLAALGVVGAIGLYVHPLFALPIALWSIIFLALFWREISFARLGLLLVVVPAAAVIPNLPWIIPFFFEDPLSLRKGGIGHQSYVGWDMILKEPFGVWSGPIRGSKIYSVLIAASGLAVWLNRAQRDRRMIVCFLLMSILTILYAGLGASVEVFARYTQPNRFAPLGYLYLTVPAAIGIASALNALFETPRGTARKQIAAVTLICAALIAINLNELRREISRNGEIGHYGAVPPRVRAIGSYTQNLLAWLNANTDRDARVLFEVSRGRKVDGGHLAGYLAYVSDREFIGGHYPDNYFADFTDGELFGRRIPDLPHETFNDFADLYNIGWVIAYTPDSVEYFDRSPRLTRLGEYREFAMYRIERTRSYFVSGSGRIVDRRHNRLVLDELAGEEVILKYHYLRGLESQPPVELEPVYLGGDPNAFIRIRQPPAALELSFR